MSITTPPKDYTTMFLDMNSFFASVEQQVQPTLRGKPIGVAPYAGNTGCIIAASREAKEYGVKICQVGEAKKLCPKIQIIEARPALYMLYHKEIRKVIESFTPYFEPLSIDEFAIQLTPIDQNYERSVVLAQNIKKAIKDRVGDYLSSSVGVAANKFLAKTAGERKKPDGLTVVRLSDLEKFYSMMRLTDLPGINYHLEARLKNFRIDSPLDFFNSDLPTLRRILNHGGRLWYYRLRGYEVDNLTIKNKTIGHSHVLPPELRSYDGAIAVIKKLIAKSGYRLRKEGYMAEGVSVAVGFMNGGGFSQSKKFSVFCDQRSITENVFHLLKECHWQKPVYVSMALFGLNKTEGKQISIFPEIEKSRAISEAMDKVNDEFGAGTVFPASVYLARESAPDRIPFGRPRYEIIN